MSGLSRVAVSWLLVVAACSKAPHTTLAVVDASPVASVASVAASAAPIDPHALEAACVEKERAHCSAEERYTRGGVDGGDDLEACTRRNALACVSEASRIGSGLSLATLAACARSEADLATRSLALWGQTTSYCTVKGTLAQGRSCAYDSQCSSGHCMTARGAPCGNCGDELPFAAGMACVVDRCGGGLECVNGRCVLPKPEGSACSASEVCSAEASCVGGTCVPRAKKGQRCADDEKSAPACIPPLDCDERSAKCIDRKPGRKPKKLAEACDNGDSCARGYCKKREGERGLCVAYSQDGMGCEVGEDTCQSPARCRDGGCVIGRPFCPAAE